MRPALARFEAELRRLYEVMDRRLADYEYIAGSYSIADIGIYGWASGYKRQRIDPASLPRFTAWLERVRSRPAVQRGDQAGANLLPPSLNPMSPDFDADALRREFARR